jgi:hypothetical protein
MKAVLPDADETELSKGKKSQMQIKKQNATN